MDLSEDDQNLFEEGIVLSTNKLIPSRVQIDDEEDCKYSADLYATTSTNDIEIGFLHLKLFDGTSEDFDPSITFEGKKVSEVRLEFCQEETDNGTRILYKTDNNATIIFTNGESKPISTPSELNSLSLVFAAKIFFVDIIRILIDSNNNRYSLNS